MTAYSADGDLHVFDNGIKVHRRHLIPVQVDRYAQGENLHEPEEERLFLELVREANPSGTFLDVGAAVGYYGILAKQSVPTLKIHAFEPYPRHRQYLQENLVLNGLGRSAIAVHAEAVGAARGHADFRIQHYGSTLIPGTARISRSLRERFASIAAYFQRKPSPDDGSHSIPVPVTTLDEVVRHHGPAELVKVDVQGFEGDVLRGAIASLSQKSIARWLIGTHGRARHEECRNILSQNGYHIHVDSPVVPGQPDGVIIAKAA